MNINLKRDFKKILKVLLVCWVSFTLIYATYKAITYKEDKFINIVYRKNIELDYYNAKNNLVDTIDFYIRKTSPNSIMNGVSFVDYCDQYNINLFFVLAQCQIESNFAATGLGAKMNSAFNVGAYDNKGTLYMKKYEHPDLSIQPYLELLNDYYLVNGKTEYELMHKYVNANGTRYASDKLYEQKLFNVYKNLTEKYDSIYNSYIKYKTLNNL